jgi:transposase
MVRCSLGKSRERSLFVAMSSWVPNRGQKAFGSRCELVHLEDIRHALCVRERRREVGTCLNACAKARAWQGPQEFQELCAALWKKAEPQVVGMGQKYEALDVQRARLSKIFAGIMYKARTGCQWSMIPKEYGSKSSVHEYFQRWTSMGIFENLFKECSEEYDVEVGFEWESQAQDGTIIQAPTRQKKVLRIKRASGQIRRIEAAQAARSTCMLTATEHP